MRDMGEMSMRSRPRKDLAASFNRLRRMVGDIKSARKSLAVHHSFMAELVSVSLFSAVPSSKASSPRSPPCYPQPHYSEEMGNWYMPSGSPVPCPAPPSSKAAASGPRNLQLGDVQEVGIESPILQIDNVQEVGAASWILQGPLQCSVLPTATSTSSSLGLAASRISALPTPSPPSSVSSSPTPLPCEDIEEANCVNNKFFMPLCQQIAANPSKCAAQLAFWACLLFLFICFFHFVGKEVAVGITITAYLVSFKGLSVSKQISRYTLSGHSMEFHSQSKERMRLSGNSSIPTHVNDILLSFSESHFCTRSQSLQICAQEVHTSEPGISICSAPSLTPLRNVGTHSARVKLGIMLVLALFGLAHGQIMAVCMCSCCALMFSEMQRLASKRCNQEIEYNILKKSLRQLST